MRPAALLFTLLLLLPSGLLAAPSFPGGGGVGGGSVVIGNFEGDWSAVVSYSIGDAVIHAGELYISRVGSNLNNEPDTSPTEWFHHEGPPGPAGPAGRTWHSGAGAPADGTGENGDFYLDTTADAYYGPKAGGTWTATGPVTLVGPTGPTGPQGSAGATGSTGPQGPTGPEGPAGDPGADGKTWHSGSGAPGSGIGVNGDFYLDTAAPAFYGPKAGGSWSGTGPRSLEPGATGATGAPGTDGKTWHSGSGAPSDSTGVNGDFYVDTAADAYYGPKAAGTWVGTGPTALVGPQGSQGNPGTPGAGVTWQGAWAVGTTYAADDAVEHDGNSYISNAAGNIGNTPGVDPEWDLWVERGNPGTSWHTGAGAPADGTGVNGDFYLDTTDDAYYGPKAAGTWTGTGPTALIGPQGPQGQTGSHANYTAEESCFTEVLSAPFGALCTEETEGQMFQCLDPSQGGASSTECDAEEDWTAVSGQSDVTLQQACDAGDCSLVATQAKPFRRGETTGAHLLEYSSGGDIVQQCLVDADGPACDLLFEFGEDGLLCTRTVLADVVTELECWENTGGTSWERVIYETQAIRLSLGKNLEYRQTFGGGVIHRIQQDGRVISPLNTKRVCLPMYDLAATDDDVVFTWFPYAVTITGISCKRHQSAAPTLAPTLTLEDDDGNAMTITGTNPTCAAPGTEATVAAVTAGNALIANEAFRFDTTNTPNPATDEYTICVDYLETPP